MKMTPNLAPSAINRNQSVSRRHPGVESLEARIAPAAIATPATFSYTDGDGDVVQVQISGKAGTVEFLDGAGADVAVLGGDLAKIIITKPSADFSIAFADTNSATGNNLIDLGTIVGAGDTRVPVIKGIFTADSTPDVAYRLGGFFGTDFSSGGGLGIVGKVVGDGIGATTDVDLKSLGKGTTLSFRGVDAGATVQIAGKVVGSISTPTLDGDLSLGTALGRVRIGHIGGSLTVQKDFGGRLDLGDSDALALAATEAVTVKGSVLASGVIHATQDLELHVTKDLGGSVIAGGNLQADVGGMLKGVSMLAGEDVTLDITGAVVGSSIVAQHTVVAGTVFKKGMSASSIVGGTGLNLEVTGSVAKSRFSSGTANLDVAISGKVSGSQFLAGGDATVSTGFAVDGSSILPDGRLYLTVGTPAQGVIPGVGDVTKSVIGSKSTSATVNIGGKVAGSQFTAGTDLNLTVGKSIASSAIHSANDLVLDVATNVQGSRFAIGSDAYVTIGGQLASSALIVSNNLDATIGQAGLPVAKGVNISAGVIKSRIETSDGSSTLSVVGPITGTVIDSGQHATLDVADLTGLDPITNTLKLLKAGSVGADVVVVAPGDVTVNASGVGKVSAKIVSGHDVSVDVAGMFGGAINAANDLTFGAGSVAMVNTVGKATVAAGTIPTPVLVPGSAGSVNISATGGIRVGGDLSFVVAGNVVAPLVEVAGNVKDFRVGGGLTGGIFVGGNFVAGTTTAAATVIGGAVGASTFLHIGGDLGSDASGPELVFGQGFAGQIQIGGNLFADLTFRGSVNRIAIDGRIGPANPGGPGDAVADIVVKGKLNSFSSASLFHRTTASGGNFIDGTGAMCGVLQADGGAALVGPFLM